MSRLLRVKRKRYSSPACIMRISRPNANKLLECSIGSDWCVSLLRVNKLNGAFIPSTPWYVVNDLNDNHYRIGLSTIIFIIYKKTIFAYTWINFEKLKIMSKPIVEVAIALLLHRNKVLVGWREAKQHQGNKYEFPGGKVEQGELPSEACRREIREEVGIDISTWHPFDLIRHEYDDLHVHLHIFHGRVLLEQMDVIQTPWTWYSRAELKNLAFPKANDVIIERLNWSEYLKISAGLNDLEGLNYGTWMYLRAAPTLHLIQTINALPASKLNKLIVNIELWQGLEEFAQKQLAAVQIKHDQLMRLDANVLPLGIRSIASCHDVFSIAQAQNVGCDAIMLSPVHTTATHADARALGWEPFKQMCLMSDLPVFALGGLSPSDLDIAQQHGAYGVAGIRNF